jgi:membrane protease YdiL (CAAX protease family)
MQAQEGKQAPPPASSKQPDSPVRRIAPAVEAMLVLALTLPLAIALGYPTIWFVTPFAVLTISNRPYEDFGLTLRNPGSPGFHAAVFSAVLGGYCLAHYAFGRWYLGRGFVPTIPPNFPQFLITQVLVIGLSEEFFFRGYLQTQINRCLGRPYRFLGARWGSGLLLTALVFGLCHVVTGGWSRMDVVAFGLFAGWLRERTGTIAVPAVYHGLANVLHDFMQRSLQ